MPRNVQLLNAANEDIENLLPRRESREVLVRHLLKLENWSSDAWATFDLVVASNNDGYWELYVDDSFGFANGLVAQFYERPDRDIWILGVQRANESGRNFNETISARLNLIELVVQNDSWN